MRARLSVILSLLMASVLISLAVPLGREYSERQARALHSDRRSDLTRLADIVPADPTPSDLQVLAGDLRRYDEVYRIPVVVLSAGARPLASSRPGVSLAGAGEAIDAALAGRESEPLVRLVPWVDEPVVVAQPVVDSGDVVAVVISLSDPAAARERVLRAWALLCGVVLLGLAGTTVLARRLAAWALRPVGLLDEAAHRIASGDLSARTPRSGGPPELRRLAASFNVMAGHVEASDAAQRAFVADASHQLRNPLGSLMLRMQALAPRLLGAEQEAAVRALDDGRHLTDVLDRLLELARAEHRGAEPAALDVVEVVADRMAAWEPVAQRRSIRMHLTGVGSAAGWHETSALAGAIDAVLDNALKFSPDGGEVEVLVESRVDRGVDADDDGVAVTVVDHGPGMAPEELARATDRFWRGRRHPTVPGSGLGLSIAEALMTRHGGTLRVARGLPGGLRVTLRVRSGLAPPVERGRGGV